MRPPLMRPSLMSWHRYVCIPINFHEESGIVTTRRPTMNNKDISYHLENFKVLGIPSWKPGTKTCQVLCFTTDVLDTLISIRHPVIF